MRLIVFALLFSLSAWAAESMKWNHSHFEAAQKAPTHFGFEGQSTKLGFITTGFTGEALEGELIWTQEQALLKDVTLLLVSSKIDTDNDNRNEKMWELCLNSKKNPTIKVLIDGAINLALSEQKVTALMTVRETTVKIPLIITKIDQKQFRGEGAFSLKASQIPDPSIAIAKVIDEMKVKFQVTLP